MRSHVLPLSSDAAAVSSCAELVAYVMRLQGAIEGGVEVENDTLDRFLGALAEMSGPLPDAPTTLHP